jgi:predicted DNA-binding helix-hairpin-helix protein
MWFNIRALNLDSVEIIYKEYKVKRVFYTAEFAGVTELSGLY